MRLHVSLGWSSKPEVFVQQTMKTASSDEELAFKQKEKDAQMQLEHYNAVGEVANTCAHVLVIPPCKTTNLSNS